MVFLMSLVFTGLKALLFNRFARRLYNFGRDRGKSVLKRFTRYFWKRHMNGRPMPDMIKEKQPECTQTEVGTTIETVTHEGVEGKKPTSTDIHMTVTEGEPHPEKHPRIMVDEDIQTSPSPALTNSAEDAALNPREKQFTYADVAVMPKKMKGVHHTSSTPRESAIQETVA